MLVVVHDEQTIGVIRQELVVEVFIMRRNVDVETKMARMKIGVELGDQGAEGGLSLIGNLFQVEDSPR